MNPDNAARALQAGANLTINTMNPDNLVRLAGLARQHDVMLTIVGTMNPDNMVRVARVGGKNVTFDTAIYDVKG